MYPRGDRKSKINCLTSRKKKAGHYIKMSLPQTRYVSAQLCCNPSAAPSTSVENRLSSSPPRVVVAAALHNTRRSRLSVESTIKRRKVKVGLEHLKKERNSLRERLADQEIVISNLNATVDKVTSEKLDLATQLKALLLEAHTNRATASTLANNLSSRSHSIYKILLTGSNSRTGETLKGTINLVDLAGSERPSVTLRMEETKYVNKSLSVLRQVLLALQKKSDHIPYRDSKFTFLLSPCLGDNSKTLMFINIAPFEECFTKTTHSLHFGTGVRKVETRVVKQ